MAAQRANPESVPRRVSVRPDYRERRIWLKDEVLDFFSCNAATLERCIELGICAPKIAHTNKWDARAIDARLDEMAGIAKKSRRRRWRKD